MFLLWYSSSSKKRGDYIKKLINWCLLENNEIIVDNKNIECNYKENEYLEYIEDKYINKIDINNKIYTRDCDEYTFIIDFNNQKQIITLKDKKMDFSSKIEGNIKIENNIINLKYNNSDSDKEIIIYIL